MKIGPGLHIYHIISSFLILSSEASGVQKIAVRLKELGVSVLFSSQVIQVRYANTKAYYSQNCTGVLLHFVRNGIGVVQNVSRMDMSMLSASATCPILHDARELFSSGNTIFGAVGGVEVAAGTSRFVLVRNRADLIFGPRTILLRGGSGI